MHGYLMPILRWASRRSAVVRIVRGSFGVLPLHAISYTGQEHLRMAFAYNANTPHAMIEEFFISFVARTSS